MRILVIALGFLASLAGTPVTADEGFSATLTEPSFQVDIPKLLPIELSVHPLNASKPHLRKFGSAGGFTVSVIVPTSDPGMSAEDCMRNRVPRILESFGVSSDKSILKRPAENTYALIFFPMTSPPQMQGFLFGKAETDHCIEIHIAKIPESGKEALPFAEMMLSGRIISPAPNSALQEAPPQRRP